MWKIWIQANVAFVILLFAVLTGVSAMHGRQPDWPIIGAFGATAAFPFATVIYFHLRRYRREQVRKHLAYWTAMQEIVDELARQSLTEVSAFITAFQQGDEGETVLVTSTDNPNHQALEQMADLGIAKPLSSEAIGEVPRTVGMLRYGFDFKGIGILCSLVEAAAKRRAFFERRSQLESQPHA